MDHPDANVGRRDIGGDAVSGACRCRTAIRPVQDPGDLRSRGRQMLAPTRSPTRCRPRNPRIWTDRCWPPTVRSAMVQVVDSSGRLIAQSAGSPAAPLSRERLPRARRSSWAKCRSAAEKDVWVTGVGRQNPDRSRDDTSWEVIGRPVETVVATVGWILAVCGPIVVALVAAGTYRLVGSGITAGRADANTGVVADH